MKLLFIVPKLYYGGAELQMRHIINYGIEKGYKIEVVDIETTEELKEKYKVIQLKKEIFLKKDNKIKKMLKRIQLYFLLKKMIDSKNYDYIIFFNILFLPLVYLVKTKVIFSVREYNMNYFKNYNKYLRKIFIITANNIPSYIELKKKYKSVFLQNNYVMDFDVEKEKEKLEKTYLIVSNIAKHKNILPVITLFKQLENKGYKLRIAGKITDEKYYKELLKESIGSNNISFLESLNYEKLKEEYSKAAGIIHLSKQEGTPNALLDAIKYNKKFICLNTVENNCLFAEVPIFLINDENELEKRIYKLENYDCSNELKYLQNKIEQMFSERNIIEFYKILRQYKEK